MSWFGGLGDALLNPGKLFGTNFDIGTALNDVTGVSSSAKQQYRYNQSLQNNAQAFNSTEAALERQWQTDMSNTARQRAVGDLQAAGLNPVLATGAEASSGAGATATSPGASTGGGTAAANPISMIAELVNASNNTARTETDIRNSTNLTDAEVIKALADAKKSGADTEQINAILDYYSRTGQFPGATITKSSGGGIFGLKGNTSETYPVGYEKPNKPNKVQQLNSARKKYGPWSKEYWNQ